MTHIIYLVGKAGTGKYTIALEIAKFGYIICDNQLINNPIFTLLNNDGISKIPESAWGAISKIRNSVFDFITIEHYNNYILTNELYEVEEDRKIYLQVKEMALKRNSLFILIKLIIVEQENIKRISEVARSLRHKSINPKDIYSSHPLLHITHSNLLELDVTTLTATSAAEKIVEHIRSL